MSFENIRKNGSFCGFIPQQLKIKNRPELSIFPLNVLFAKRKLEGEKMITGCALYEPDILSFERDGSEWSMKYHNVYGGDCWLSIKFDEVKHNYVGEKFINGKRVWLSEGPKWEGFFIHFTMLGLANGERCEFKE